MPKFKADCYTAALRILNYRFNSEAELRRKLRAKEYSDLEIADTIARLHEEKWLDDGRFAGEFVRSMQSKRHGTHRIARELRAAGVGDEVARDAVRAAADPDEERARALALARKRLPSVERRESDPLALRNKLTGYLLNQGYDSALVREVVKEVLSGRSEVADHS